jgi:hypothetical protein
MRLLTGWRRNRLRMVKTQDGQRVWRSASASSKRPTRRTSVAFAESLAKGFKSARRLFDRIFNGIVEFYRADLGILVSFFAVVILIIWTLSWIRKEVVQ